MHTMDTYHTYLHNTHTADTHHTQVNNTYHRHCSTHTMCITHKHYAIHTPYTPQTHTIHTTHTSHYRHTTQPTDTHTQRSRWSVDDCKPSATWHLLLVSWCGSHLALPSPGREACVFGMNTKQFSQKRQQRWDPLWALGLVVWDTGGGRVAILRGRGW